MLNLEDTQTTSVENTKTPWQDPILLDLHATRERLANAYGNDIRAICDAARAGYLCAGAQKAAHS